MPRAKERGPAQKSILLNSGAEAVENAVKIARVATGRPAVVVFENAFHGRTSLTMAMTAKVVPYKRGFGPLAAEVYRAPHRRSRGCETLALELGDVDPASVACVVLEPVQGEGGFIAMPRDFLTRPRASSATSTGSSTSTTRCSRAAAAPGPCGRSSTTASSPTCSSPASRSEAAYRSRRSRAAPTSWTPSRPAGSAVPSAATPSRARRPAPSSTRSPRPDSASARTSSAAGSRRARASSPGRETRSAASARCWRSSSPSAPPTVTTRVTAAARERGLILLSCGTYGNVIRILVPLVISDEELERGLDILEEAVGDARGG